MPRPHARRCRGYSLLLPVRGEAARALRLRGLGPLIDTACEASSVAESAEL